MRPQQWARRQPTPSAAKQRQAAQLRRDLPLVSERIAEYGLAVLNPPADMSRSELTRLQRQLTEATEVDPRVADDNFMQQVRRQLHLLLDH